MAISKLQEFLANRHLERVLDAKVTLKDDDGKENAFMIKFKTLSRSDYARFQNASIEINPKDNTTKFNPTKMTTFVLAACLLEPNLRNAEFQMKVMGRPAKPTEMIDRLFSYSEAEAIASAIAAQSGIEEISIEMIDQAKKS